MAFVKFENKNGGGSAAPQPVLISAANATAVVYGGTVTNPGGTVPAGTYEEIQILNDQSGKTIKLYFTDLTSLDTAADLQTFIGYVIGLINTASLKGPDSSFIDSEYVSPSYLISTTLTAITLDGVVVA